MHSSANPYASSNLVSRMKSSYAHKNVYNKYVQLYYRSTEKKDYFVVVVNILNNKKR